MLAYGVDPNGVMAELTGRAGVTLRVRRIHAYVQ